ncbi:MAG: AsnC family transcriptional regulator [Candidatus Aminicenantes bacterium]|nr:Rrf2 family transcriptional regulator [Candidatus Aminicenantes bacterium]RLE03162.1 MAG: AsnC family transcriptional regulator [Candidatus Aminicenantes bacterium]HHF42187.1 Rrf2 family transcriptional regulator [Candidatus Aminicenantes bacterium]
MLKISTKGRYGTRLMLNLARHYQPEKNYAVLKSISAEEDIPLRYLEQIIIPLKLNKLVKSMRGSSGGYILARPPSQIRISEIILAMEGPLTLVECVEDKGYCSRAPSCAPRKTWAKASQLLFNYFDQLTLADLVKLETSHHPHK